MGGSWAFLPLVLAFCLSVSGCLVEIVHVHAPSRAFVSEGVVLRFQAHVSGSVPGRVGFVMQVPDSCEVGDIVLVGALGTKLMKRSPSLERLYPLEKGRKVIAVLDSMPRAGISTDTLSLFIYLRFLTAGKHTCKFVAGEVQGQGKAARWATLDPRMPADFAALKDSTHRVTIQVIEGGRGAQNALAFSGNRQYVLLPDTVAAAVESDSGWTMEFWLKSEARNVPLLSARSSDIISHCPVDLWINPQGEITSRLSDGLVLYPLGTRTVVSDGTWHHVGVSLDPRQRRMKLFVDGRTVDSLRVPDQFHSRPHELVLGTTPMRRTFFRGLVDELRIWNHARGEEDIQRFQFSVLAGDEPGLLAYYPIDDNGGLEDYILNKVGSGLLATPMNQPRIVYISAPFRSVSLSLFARVDSGRVRLQWISRGKDTSPAFEIIKRGESGKYQRVAFFDGDSEQGEQRIYEDSWSGKSVVYYRLKRINTDGSIDLSEEVPIGLEVHHNFILGDATPNPFAGSVEIPYLLKEPCHVTLTVYDALGREVAVLVSARQKAGKQKAVFDGTDHAPGNYFFKLRTTRGAQTRLMVLDRISGPRLLN